MASIKNYSQNNEQQIILDYFKDYKGTFIEIGANDGQTLSNTRALAELGWKGVCVEPSPKAFERLKELYKGSDNVYCYNFAIGHTNKEIDFWESGNLISREDVALVSTSNPEEMQRFNKTVKYEPIKVQCKRWKTFLNYSRLKQFDFVSIDTEGSELVILEQMDLIDVKLLCVEWNGKNKEKFDHFAQGFKLIYTSAENLIYAR